MESDRITAYLHSLEPEPDPRMAVLREQAVRDRVPILRQETESFLRTLCCMQKPKRILEIGTAIGYSALVMASACEAEILTIENYEKRIPIALANIQDAGMQDRICLRPGDAGEILKQLIEAGDCFDLVFLDAAKGQYLNWLPDILSLMHNGSVLLADNVLQDGTVTESRFTIERRERTTHVRMRDFLYEIKHMDTLETSVIPLGDGVSISVAGNLKR